MGKPGGEALGEGELVVDLFVGGEGDDGHLRTQARDESRGSGSAAREAEDGTGTHGIGSVDAGERYRVGNVRVFGRGVALEKRRGS